MKQYLITYTVDRLQAILERQMEEWSQWSSFASTGRGDR